LARLRVRVWVFFSVAPVISMVDISSTLQDRDTSFGGRWVVDPHGVPDVCDAPGVDLGSPLSAPGMEAGARMTQTWTQAAQNRDEVLSAALAARRSCTMV